MGTLPKRQRSAAPLSSPSSRPPVSSLTSDVRKGRLSEDEVRAEEFHKLMLATPMATIRVPLHVTPRHAVTQGSALVSHEVPRPPVTPLEVHASLSRVRAATSRHGGKKKGAKRDIVIFIPTSSGSMM